MICAACGRDNPAQAKFCLDCGARLAVRCAACATALPDGAKFCLGCGAPVGGRGSDRAAGRPEDGSAGASPSRHQPDTPPFQPHVQYVTTADGVRIAYATFGAGGGVPLVVLRGALFSHVGAEWRLWAMRLVEPLRVRVGVNAGEPIAENDDLFGAAVIIASRLADEANSGQIVVADVVRQLVAGKDFVFSDRGETPLKGIQAPIRTWELLW